jgi:polyhydroxybutyrate depolymerase
MKVLALSGAALLAAFWGWRRYAPRGPLHGAKGAGTSEVLPRAPSTAAARVSTPARASLLVDGVQRGYVLVTPVDRDAARPVALVLVFHGDGSEAWAFHAAFPFERASGADAVVAYLDGVGKTWSLEGKGENADVRFVEALIDALAATLPIDRTRVFATGYSSGGFFVNLLACKRADLVRAIASNAGGGPYLQTEVWPNHYPKCPGQRPLAAIALHGNADVNVPLASGFFSAQYWAYVNGCDDTGLDSTGYAECASYRHCPKGTNVVWCEVPGLGHEIWDHAAEVSWAFFARQ